MPLIHGFQRHYLLRKQGHKIHALGASALHALVHPRSSSRSKLAQWTHSPPHFLSECIAPRPPHTPLAHTTTHIVSSLPLHLSLCVSLPQVARVAFTDTACRTLRYPFPFAVFTSCAAGPLDRLCRVLFLEGTIDFTWHAYASLSLSFSRRTGPLTNADRPVAYIHPPFADALADEGERQRAEAPCRAVSFPSTWRIFWGMRHRSPRMPLLSVSARARRFRDDLRMHMMAMAATFPIGRRGPTPSLRQPMCAVGADREGCRMGYMRTSKHSDGPWSGNLVARIRPEAASR